MKTPIDTAKVQTAANAIARHERPTHKFAKGEDGSLIVFSLFIFVLMLIISGISLDLMRFETTRTKLQNTADRAALAAAALSQTVAPADVVADYFLKSGMSTFLNSVSVQQGFNYRQVAVTTDVNVPTHFFSMVGIENLSSPANATALEAIGNVEISLVLDVSGSMNWYNRLTNLKSASADFIDTVYQAAEPGTVSTSIIPYATQVSVGQNLLSYYNVTEAHNRSYCVNFSVNDYSNVGLSTTTPLQQTIHFDPWYRTKPLYMPVCESDPSREIMPWSQDPVALKAYVNNFTAGGNTSTDIGLKWGAALLDPGSQSIVTGMIGTGDVDSWFAGRPFSYINDDTMKVIVVMTDGANTSQYYIKDGYRTGLTNVWSDPSSDRISIWSGNGTEPVATNGWSLNNNEFYVPQNGNFGDYWDSKPEGNGNAVRMTWPDIWARSGMRYYSDYEVYPMNWSYSEWYAIATAYSSVSGWEKNTRMANVCTAAKNEGVIIFAVGLEVTDSNANRLEACASSPAHFFRVNALDIGYAFRAIASQINQLRLTQ